MASVELIAKLMGFDEAQKKVDELTKSLEKTADATVKVNTAAGSGGGGNGPVAQLGAAAKDTGVDLDFMAKMGTAAASALGVALAGSVVRITKEFFEGISTVRQLGDQLNNLSQRTGMSVEQLGGLQLAAKTNNLSLEQLTTTIQLFNRNIEGAIDGKGRSAEAFKKLGISIVDSSGKLKESDTLLREVAKEFAAMPDGVHKTTTAMDLFGRSGSNLIPMLNEGADGLARLEEEARKTGIVMSKETAEAANKLNANMEVLSSYGKGFWITVASPIVEGLAYITSGARAAAFEMGRVALLIPLHSTIFQLGKNAATPSPGDLTGDMREANRLRTLGGFDVGNFNWESGAAQGSLSPAAIRIMEETERAAEAARLKQLRASETEERREDARRERQLTAEIKTINAIIAEQNKAADVYVNGIMNRTTLGEEENLATRVHNNQISLKELTELRRNVDELYKRGLEDITMFEAEQLATRNEQATKSAIEQRDAITKIMGSSVMEGERIFSGFAQSVQGVVRELLSGNIDITRQLGTIWKGLWGSVLDEAARIITREAIGGLLDPFKDVFKSIGEFIKNDVFGNIWSYIKSGFLQVVAWLKTLDWGSGFSGLSSAISNLFGGGSASAGGTGGVGGIGGIGGIGGGAGAGMGTMGATLAAAGQGAMIGNTMANFMHAPKSGVNGGTIGGAIGFVVGGPIGGAIGSFAGTVLGSLFGSNKSRMTPEEVARQQAEIAAARLSADAQWERIGIGENNQMMWRNLTNGAIVGSNLSPGEALYNADPWSGPSPFLQVGGFGYEAPAAASGTDMIISRPTRMLVGEAGSERVTVSPLGGAAHGHLRGGGGGLTINGAINIVDEYTMRKARRALAA